MMPYTVRLQVIPAKLWVKLASATIQLFKFKFLMVSVLKEYTTPVYFAQEEIYEYYIH